MEFRKTAVWDTKTSRTNDANQVIELRNQLIESRNLADQTIYIRWLIEGKHQLIEIRRTADWDTVTSWTNNTNQVLELRNQLIESRNLAYQTIYCRWFNEGDQLIEIQKTADLYTEIRLTNNANQVIESWNHLELFHGNCRSNRYKYITIHN